MAAACTPGRAATNCARAVRRCAPSRAHFPWRRRQEYRPVPLRSPRRPEDEYCPNYSRATSRILRGNFREGIALKVYNAVGYACLLFYAAGCALLAPPHLGPWVGLGI